MSKTEHEQDSSDLGLHPEVWRRGGQTYVLLPYEEFVRLLQALNDERDLRLLREARAADDDSPGVPLDDVLKELGLSE